MPIDLNDLVVPLVTAAASGGVAYGVTKKTTKNLEDRAAIAEKKIDDLSVKCATSEAHIEALRKTDADASKRMDQFEDKLDAKLDKMADKIDRVYEIVLQRREP